MSNLITYKQAYERPTLTNIGGVGEVTLASTGGTVADATVVVEPGGPIPVITTS